MKFTSAALLVLLSLCCQDVAVASSSGVGGRSLRQNPTDNSHRSLAGCPGDDEDFSVSFDGDCDYDELKEAVEDIKSGSCNVNTDTLLQNLLGAGNDAQARDKVKQLCRSAVSDTSEGFDFSDITKKGEQFDNEYYEGGTYFNYEIENDSGDHRLKNDASRINRIYQDEAQSRVIDLPLYLNAFDPDQDGCEIDAAFCCWVQDRQAGDNNGNCGTPYESQCIDRDPGDNANFCYTDHTRSGADVQGGFSIFGNVLNNQENIEGAIHCHGFAWGPDENDVSNIYKGNNLFYVSLYDHMHQRGYVRNAPGSAMCGCAENMAVVTRADCTEIEADQTYTFNYSGSFQSVLSKVKKVRFNACQGANNRNNDLEAYYKRLVNEGKQTQANLEKLQKTLVGAEAGKCNQAIVNFMASKGISRSNGANSISENTITPDMIIVDESEPKIFEVVDNDYEWEKASNTAGKSMPLVAYDVTEDFAEKGTEEEEKPEKPSKDDDDEQSVTMTDEEAELVFQAEEAAAAENYSEDEVEEGEALDEDLKQDGATCKLAGECESGLCKEQKCEQLDIASDNNGEEEDMFSIGGIGATSSNKGGVNNTGDWW